MTTVYFFHGAFSSPQSIKIGRLKTIAESLGFDTVIPDHSAIREPDKRVADMRNHEPDASCILVGSSMGGYVATVLSTTYSPHALFLMAPAIFMPATTYEQQNLTPSADHVEIIHGWHDDIIPAENSIKFARQHNATLHLVNGEHNLRANLDTVAELFTLFLNKFTH